MRTIKLGLLGFLLWAGLSAALPAREKLFFQTFSLEQGLSQSIVECILQDRRGFLWLGTEDGLNRYDGYSFTVFKEESNEPNSLSHDNILCLLEDDKGLIWIGTYHGGLNCYDPEAGKFRRFQNVPGRNDSLVNDVVTSLAQDGQGTIWVGTNAGLESWNPDTGGFVHAAAGEGAWSQLSGIAIGALYVDTRGCLWIGTQGRGMFRVETPGSPPVRHPMAALDNAIILSIAEDNAGRIWIGTQNRGAFRWTTDDGGWRHFPFNQNGRGELNSPTVRTILADRSGTIWLGTDNGLHKHEGDGKGFTVHCKVFGDDRSIAHNEIHCLFEDRGEVLWVGTYGGGVSKSIGRKNHFIHYRSNPDDPNSLGNDIVWSFYEDVDGMLWIGTHGGGLDRLNRKNNRFKHYRHRPGDPSSLNDNRVRVVMKARDGFFWLGTNNGGLSRFDPKTETFTAYRNDPGNPSSISSDTIRCILEDTLGNLWVGTLGGGLNRLDRKSGRFTRFVKRPGDPQTVSNNVIRVLHESPPGVLWIGTYGGGVDRLDIRSGHFTHLRAKPDDPEGLSNNYIFSIHEDDNGIVWIGNEGGLNRLDPKTGKIRCYGVNEGLPDNTVYGIVEDNDGRLWLSTSKGLGRFDPKTAECRNFHYIDGLQNDEFNGGAYYRNSRGELFFGGINGFNIINPARIRENNYLPPVVLSDFRKFNQTVSREVPIYTLEKVVLSHRDDMVSFGFAALDFTVPEKNRYAYRMEGLSDKWIQTGADHRYATFTSLPAGKYFFRVKGSNNNGVWNHAGATVEVRVLPPWWKTWWFQLGLLLVALATIVISYRLRIREVKHETRMRAELRAAHEAQASIMPCRSPLIAGFDIAGASIPASEVGGDFFDYLWTGEDKPRFAVAVGDVSGKGMKAAMTAVMADGILCASAAQTQDIGAIMSLLNHALVRKTDRKDFVAMVIAAFDGEAVEFINSGLPDPLLKRDGQILRLAPEGTRLPPGVRADRRFAVARRTMLPGDVLVFFSDGVSEAMDGARKLYGRERLEKHLQTNNTHDKSAREILDDILADVEAFMAAAEARDDITVVVVKNAGG